MDLPIAEHSEKHSQLVLELGKPDAGKPPVRFDEGRSETVIGLCLSTRRSRLLYISTVEILELRQQGPWRRNLGLAALAAVQIKSGRLLNGHLLSYY